MYLYIYMYNSSTRGKGDGRGAVVRSDPADHGCHQARDAHDHATMFRLYQIRTKSHRYNGEFVPRNTCKAKRRVLKYPRLIKVMAAARSCDLILLIMDATKPYNGKFVPRNTCKAKRRVLQFLHLVWFKA